MFLILGLPHIDLVASKVNKNLSVFASLTKGEGEVYVVGMYKSGTIIYRYVFPPPFPVDTQDIPESVQIPGAAAAFSTRRAVERVVHASPRLVDTDACSTVTTLLYAVLEGRVS